MDGSFGVGQFLSHSFQAMMGHLSADIQKHLANPLWRLNNLYTIIDKEGVQRLFKFNYAQKAL